MPNDVKTAFLDAVRARYGLLRKLPGSQSLYDLVDCPIRLYIRYSRVHPRGRTFYGLRSQDLRLMEGHPSLICFLWDEQPEPLLIPHSEFEEVLRAVGPAADGQYKVQVFLQEQGTSLYIARAGRFNVDAYIGWGGLEALFEAPAGAPLPDLTHSQVQTLLGAIGCAKGFDVWVPAPDRERLDWSLAHRFEAVGALPEGFEAIRNVIQEVDIIWVKRGSSELRALFEVEHSTPIYSGLLRLNDVHLTAPNLHPTFNVVANEERRDVFVRQLNRPTFRASGLHEMCSFLDYANVFGWYGRLGLMPLREEERGA